MCDDKGLSIRRKLATLAAFVVICMGLLVPAEAAKHPRRKAKGPLSPPVLSGPTGPLPQIPLDSIAPVPPVVRYENGQLTIVAANSTLADILRAVHSQTGAEVDVATANDRVVTQLGPAP